MSDNDLDPNDVAYVHPSDRRASGLARLDARGLAQLRSIIAEVIAGGCPRHNHSPWLFSMYPKDDRFTNQEREDFIETICQRIIATTTPAIAAGARIEAGKGK